MRIEKSWSLNPGLHSTRTLAPFVTRLFAGNFQPRLYSTMTYSTRIFKKHDMTVKEFLIKEIAENFETYNLGPLCHELGCRIFSNPVCSTLISKNCSTFSSFLSTMRIEKSWSLNLGLHLTWTLAPFVTRFVAGNFQPQFKKNLI